MKKKNNFILLLATVALAALTSCIDKRYDTDKMDGMDVTVAVDKSTEVDSGQILSFDNGAVVQSDTDGTLYVEKYSETVLETAGLPKPGNPVKFDQEVTISKEEIPENSNGSNPGAILRITNSGKPVTVKSKITCSGMTESLPDFTLDGNGEFIVFFGNGSDLPAPDWADIKMTLPDNLRFKLGEGFTIHDIEIHSAEKSTVRTLSEDTYTYTVETAYCSPLAYTEGQSLYVEKSLSDLSVNLDEYIKDLPGNRFSVKVSVKSTIPFNITGKIISNDGITGVLDNVIKAGTEDNPVTTEAVFSVTVENRSVSLIRNATICATLTAPGDAVLKDSQTLEMDIKEITINIK